MGPPLACGCRGPEGAAEPTEGGALIPSNLGRGPPAASKDCQLTVLQPELRVNSRFKASSADTGRPA